MSGTAFTYSAGGADCIGYLALPEGDGPCPGVLVSPAFRGLSDMERGSCDRLAAMGYVALGVDYYSGGRETTERAEAAGWMAELQGNRPLLAARMQGALAALTAQPRVAGQKIGAVGYCLGGKSVLDLARSGAEFAAGVTFHGVYDAPPEGSQPMKAALLICDGWDDSLCPPGAKVALAEELTAHCPDWQMLAFGQTGHAFTNPAAAVGNGFGYSAAAERRSWAAMSGFFEEMLRG
ncbi:dienelactone hydrolase family protein [Pseudooceanicola sp. C21-150M6]|uniref:dienelactone hydrolase family protein n=1 Tax=Pseudooceanicola sp. C21-150M6 TaxID=3434355 RepID=UPI003D7F453D